MVQRAEGDKSATAKSATTKTATLRTFLLIFFVCLSIATAGKLPLETLFQGTETLALTKGDPRPRPPSPGRFRLYGMRFCPFTERVLMYMAKKNIKAEVVNVNLKDKPEWLKEVHPEEKVPVLEHDGKIIIDSVVIPQYLDDLFPESSILPSDPYGAAVQRMRYELASCFINPLYKLLKSKPENRDEAHSAIESKLKTVESMLSGKYFAEDHAGFTDYLIFPHYERIVVFSDHPAALKYNMTSLVGNERFPNLTQWYHRMCSLPEVKVARPQPDQVSQYLETKIEGRADPDIGLTRGSH